MPAWALRLLPWAAGALAALWLASVVNGWREDAQRLRQVEREFDVYRTGIETAARVREEVSNGYQAELSALRAAAGSKPPPAVRLCQPAPAVVPAAGTASGRDGSGAAAGQLPAGTGPDHPAGPGPDIGADLYRLADRADELSAQLRACQGFAGRVKNRAAP